MFESEQNKEYLRERAKRVVDDPRYYLGGMRGRYPSSGRVRERAGSQEFDVFASDETSAQAEATGRLLLGLKFLLEESV